MSSRTLPALPNRRTLLLAVSALVAGPLLARTASLVAHILEEQTRPIGFKLASAAEHAMTYDGPPVAR